MLKENLILLRGIHGFSQEEIAEKINISRQAYSKWESGATVPDIEKCMMLAKVYNISLDNLVNSESKTINDVSTLNPKGKNIWGTVTINNRGQIVIPKGARNLFDLSEGTRLIVLSDEDGIALIRAEKFEENIKNIMKIAAKYN